MKTCRNCAEYWWCKLTWNKKEWNNGIDEDMKNCRSWKHNHKYTKR